MSTVAAHARARARRGRGAGRRASARSRTGSPASTRSAGWVRNDGAACCSRSRAPSAAVESFLERLASEAPPLAVVERVRAEPLPRPGQSGFRILDSERAGQPATLVAADAAPCADCLAELFDPRDRRYRYPFINCTNCGPRFTIVRGVPYDRPLTTMAAFEMCAAVPRRVRGSGAAGASTRSRTPARRAGRRRA